MLKHNIDGAGIYTLIIGVYRPSRIKVGKLGCLDLAEGFYTYTGSALGKSTNLKTRINRHLGLAKKMHWHIDYLLESEDTLVKAIIYVKTRFKGECYVTKGMERLGEVTVPMRGFGSSDCTNKCASHLHYFPNLSLEEAISRIINVYSVVFGSRVTVFYTSEED